MFIATIPNRSSPPAVLLRESYREGKQVKSRTLANLTGWPVAKIEALRRVLRNELLTTPSDAFTIERSLPHGHVAAVLGTLRRIGLETMLSSRRTTERDLVVAMIVSRVIDPRSKLATAQGLQDECATSSLGEVLDVASRDEDALYGAMDWLLEKQERIEKVLAKKHLQDGTLALFDASSTYFEGRTCPLARIGYSRDGKKGTLQIVLGLLCNKEGCPVAVRVFEGNTGDPKTFTAQVNTVRDRFGLKRIVMVGDRGMITDARIREDLEPHEGLDWITALRAPAIQKLAAAGVIQRSLFDQKDMGVVTDPAFPGERLVVCRNPLLADERARKREDLLRATEISLSRILQAVQRSRHPLRGQTRIALKVGKVIDRFKMSKHFKVEITDSTLRFERDETSIAAEKSLDGIYVIRTNVPEEKLASEEAVLAYKRLSTVERAFRSLKTVDLRIRPIHHRLADRVRAHVFLCMLAYYVEWHIRLALAPIVFDDDDKPSAASRRASPVAPAVRSLRAEAKAQSKRTEDDFPAQSLQGLLRHLATLTKNRVRTQHVNAPAFEQFTLPTRLQSRAFELLHVSVKL